MPHPDTDFEKKWKVLPEEQCHDGLEVHYETLFTRYYKTQPDIQTILGEKPRLLVWNVLAKKRYSL